MLALDANILVRHTWQRRLLISSLDSFEGVGRTRLDRRDEDDGPILASALALAYALNSLGVGRSLAAPLAKRARLSRSDHGLFFRRLE